MTLIDKQHKRMTHARKIFLVVFLIGIRADSAVLVPSSQFSMALTPTFTRMTPKAMIELQQYMEDVLIRTAQIIHLASLQPKHMNVVIQEAFPVTYNTSTDFQLKTTNVTFVVLGTYDRVSSSSGQEFMDSLVVDAFDKHTYKKLLLSLLHESSNDPLPQIVNLSLQKHITAIPGDLMHQDTDAPSLSSLESNGAISTVDVILIVVSSFILVVIVLLLVHGRKGRRNIATVRPSNGKSNQGTSPETSSPKLAPAESFHATFSGSSPIRRLAQLPVEPVIPNHQVNPNFRILKHSPTRPEAERRSTTASTIKPPNSNISIDTQSSPHSSTLSMATTVQVSNTASSIEKDVNHVNINRAKPSLPAALPKEQLRTGGDNVLLESKRDEEKKNEDDDNTLGIFPYGGFAPHSTAMVESFPSLNCFVGSHVFCGMLDSHDEDVEDLFGVDVLSRNNSVTIDAAEQCFATVQDKSSYKGQPMEEWFRSIRVVASGPSSVNSKGGPAFDEESKRTNRWMRQKSDAILEGSLHEF